MAALVPARFVSRPNRFTVVACLHVPTGGRPRPGPERAGSRIEAHLADPGRLEELLLPGAELRLRPAPPGGQRRTRFTVALVRAPAPSGVWVSVDTSLPNRLAERLLRNHRIPGIAPATELRREITIGGSRFDFLLRHRRGAPTLVEVKSVSLVEDGVARFPDAPTTRGTRHVRELAAHALDGGRAAILFVVQRHDARRVEPHAERDAAFTGALAHAKASGVTLRAVRFRLDALGRASFEGRLPVRLPR